MCEETLFSSFNSTIGPAPIRAALPVQFQISHQSCRIDKILSNLNFLVFLLLSDFNCGKAEGGLLVEKRGGGGEEGSVGNGRVICTPENWQLPQVRKRKGRKAEQFLEQYAQCIAKCDDRQ